MMQLHSLFSCIYIWRWTQGVRKVKAATRIQSSSQDASWVLILKRHFKTDTCKKGYAPKIASSCPLSLDYLMMDSITVWTSSLAPAMNDLLFNSFILKGLTLAFTIKKSSPQLQYAHRTSAHYIQGKEGTWKGCGPTLSKTCLITVTNRHKGKKPLPFWIIVCKHLRW